MGSPPTMVTTATEPPVDGAGDATPSGNGSGQGTNPKMRKRTKTGCLTCRKRRIKCGEERPTCANCIKSKRQCEGYNQRVVFKPPIGDWPNHPGVVSTLQYHNSMLPGSRPPAARLPGSPQSIQPRPLTQFDYPDAEAGTLPGLDPSTLPPPFSASSSFAQDHVHHPPLPSPHHQAPLQSPHNEAPLPSPLHQITTPTSAHSYFQPPRHSSEHSSYQGHYGNEGSSGYHAHHQIPEGGHYQHAPAPLDPQAGHRQVAEPAHPSNSHTYQDSYPYTQQRSAGIPEDQNPYGLATSVAQRPQSYSQYGDQGSPLTRGGGSQLPAGSHIPGHVNLAHAGPYALPTSHSDASGRSFQHFQIPPLEDVKYGAPHTVTDEPVALPHASEPRLATLGFAGDDHVSPTQVLDEAAIEYEDDDYWDVQSDEDMLDVEFGPGEGSESSNPDLTLIQRLHQESDTGLSVRRYDAFIYEGILDHYRIERAANPLRNPKTARVFAHFLYATGPSLSIYERNPSNTTAIFEGALPQTQQNLWTYILPLKALNHQGLLHAMLALSSLHIARLQRASITPSYKHYAYAIKRLSRALGNTKKRLQVTTLATSMLLAFYEVMTAEHAKWSTHLVGAAQLINELDFRSLTWTARRLKSAKMAQEAQFPHQNPNLLIDQKQFDHHLRESALMPDESLLSTIMGKKVSYDFSDSVFEEGQERKNRLPEKIDLPTYETFQDLYWWFCRQDAFQSIISGNPLIMNYRKWADCPPRAPLGFAGALTGTHDHIILLIARIAEFTNRDRQRKIKQQDANGGQWRPTPGMPGMGPPAGSQGRGQPPTPTAPGVAGVHVGWQGASGNMSAKSMPPPSQPGPPPASAIPAFYGMAPTKGPTPLPQSYTNPDPNYQTSPTTPHAPHPRYSDLAAAYDAAIADWTSILQAHSTISSILSNNPDFAPLDTDLCPPPMPPGAGNLNAAPFGPPLIYKTFNISIIWTMMHMAHILLLRSHPAMPPAAMQASSVGAAATAPFANEIGRITSGLQMPYRDDLPLNPSLGAAMIDSSLSLFFAGVQYREKAQREWLVQRMLDIDRRTGWASAAAMCRSCETSWEKAAEIGRGPPYPRRRTRRFGEEGPVILSPDEVGSTSALEVVNSSSNNDQGNRNGYDKRTVGRVYTDAEVRARNEAYVREREGWTDADKKFAVRSGGGLTPWAMNVVSTDEDLRVGMERVGLGGGR